MNLSDGSSGELSIVSDDGFLVISDADGFHISNTENITTEVEKEQIRKVVADKSFRQLYSITFKSEFLYQAHEHVIVLE